MYFRPCNDYKQTINQQTSLIRCKVILQITVIMVMADIEVKDCKLKVSTIPLPKMIRNAKLL